MMKMAAGIIIVLCLIGAVYAADPFGCSYDSTEKTYTCNTRSWSLPLNYSDFDNTVQQLFLVAVEGGLGSNTFSGSSSINTTDFDPYKIPLLSIRCSPQRSLILYAGTFTGMDWVKEVQIQDCFILSLPDDIFKELNDVNVFTISGGSLTDVGFNALNGLNVNKMSGVPNPSGTFTIKNCRITSGSLPNGLLYAMTNVSSVVIENAALEVVQKDMFQVSTKMTHLSLSYNVFNYLQNDMFTKTSSLSVLELYGIEWACTCTNIWPIEYCRTNNIALKGNLVCASPTAYSNVRGKLYDKEQCPQQDVCEGKTGVVTGSSCTSVYDLTYYSLLFVTLVICLVDVGLTVHTRRQLNPNSAPPKKNRPPLRRRKLSGSQWKQVGKDDDVQEKF